MPSRFLNNININDEYSFPSADGSADQIITTDGAGQLSFVDQSTIASGSAEVVEVPVKNLQGSALTKGDPVYISGSVGASGILEVQLADAGNSAKMPAVGLLKQDLAANAEGFAVVTGKLRNLVTSPIDGVTPSPNTVIYVKSGGTTGAALTTVKPTGSSNLIQNMGKVGRVSTSNDGTFIVSSILRSNDVPNLPTGKIWVGDGNTTVSTVVHLDETNDRMGIGTTSPETQLQIGEGTGTQRILLYGANSLSTSSEIILADSSSGPAVYRYGAGIRFDSSNNILSLRSFFNGNNTQDVSLIDLYRNTATENTPIRINYDTSFSGNVGIGTTSPSQRAVISGPNTSPSLNTTAVSNASLLISNSDTGYGTYFASTGGGIGLIQQRRQTSAVYYDLALQPYGGNVGIGTTSPGKKLHVAGDTQIDASGLGQTLLLGRANGQPSIKAQTDNGGHMIIDSTTNFMSLNHYVNKNVIMVAGGGNVGIGTTSPGEKLEVNGNVKLSETAATTDTDKFVVLDSGVLKYRTGSQIVSDLPTDTRYVAVAGDTMTGNLVMDGKAGFGNSIGLATGTNSNLPSLKFYTYNNTDPGGGLGTGTGNIIQSDLGTGGLIIRQNVNDADIIFQSDDGAGGIATYLTLDGSSTDAYFSNPGNVGIGTTSPNAKLAVSGDFGIQGILFWNTGYQSTGTGGGVANGFSIPYRTGITNLNTAYNYKVRLTTAGTGTDSGSCWLVGYNQGTATWFVRMVSQSGNTSNHPLLAINSANTQMVAYTNHASSYPIRWSCETIGISDNDGTLHNMGADFQWQRNIDNLVYSDGGVGIGTSNPVGKLSIGSGLSTDNSTMFNVDGQYNDVGFNGGTSGLLNQGVWSFINSGTWDQTRFYVQDQNNSDSRLTFDFKGNAGNTNILAGTSSGKVGIGTASPGSILHIVDSAPTLKLQADTSLAPSTISFDNSSGTQRASLIFSEANDTFRLTNTAGNSRLNLDNYTGTFSVGTSDQSGVILGATTVTLRSNYSTALTCDFAGRVGIGTTNPGYKLDVAGDLRVDNGNVGSTSGDELTHARIQGARHFIDFKEVRTANDTDWKNTTFKIQTGVDSTNHQSIDFVADGSYQEHIDIRTGNQLFNTRFTSDGKVGIGTNSPSDKLTVEDGNIRLNSTSSYPAQGLYAYWNNGSPNMGGISWHNNPGFIGSEWNHYKQSSPYTQSRIRLIGDANGGMYVNLNNSDVFSILASNGNVGIGNTSPSNSLVVGIGTSNSSDRSNTLLSETSTGGTANALGLVNSAYGAYGNATALNFHLSRSYSPTARIIAYQDGSSSQTDTGLKFFTYNGSLQQRMHIDHDGNVGIGTTSAGAKLDIFNTGGSSGSLADCQTYSALTIKPYSSVDSKLTFSANGVSTQLIQATNNAGTNGRQISLQPFSGNVGVGVILPSEKLDVNGYVKASSGYKGYVSHFHSGGFDHIPRSTDGANPFWIPSNYVVDSTVDQYYNIWVPLYAGRIRKIILKNTTGTPTATVCTFYKRINGTTSGTTYAGTVTGGGASGMKVTVDFGISNFTFNAEDEIQIGFVTGVATQPSLRGVSYQIWYEYNIT